ncbi:hypothetical protein CYY_006075 [Polysphondylium violaceum]|uniref:Uncharacterized protein n=1 Tax=Polysphondylium violaceum TaxID=133409 RepID=A0A8J4URR3_9MYCE|nr:hypothetical protein CYY_006075 [Polysphondylium violaceum]
MVLDVIEKINSLPNVVLASTSPRRIEALSGLGLSNLKIISPSFIENLDKSTFATPQDYCLENAKQKAKCVYEDIKGTSIVIGVDTICVHENKILEKPINTEAAKEMLNSLSGVSHFVYSGVFILYHNEKTDEKGQESFVTSTKVTFDTISKESINYYVEKYKPLDKAGSYGIQEVVAGSFIKGIEGDYYNVTGIPVNDISRTLRSIYVNIFSQK